MIENKANKILVPMAGAGSRFTNAGYDLPKPLIDVNGQPMIQRVVENLDIAGHYIYIVQKLHYEQYSLLELLNSISPGCDIITVDEMTEGAACTTLLAKHLLDDSPLIITNSDQVFEWNSAQFMRSMTESEVDGGILTFKDTHPKWSFVKLGSDGLVTQVAEKEPISDIATAGVYYWKKGIDYVKYAEQMISKNIRTNNEFYVCPVYNEACFDNQRISIFHIDKMWGLGTPEDLDYYLEHYSHKNV